MEKLKKSSKAILVFSSILLGVLFLVSTVFAVVQRDGQLDASALATGRDLVNQPPLDIIPIPPDYTPRPPEGPVTAPRPPSPVAPVEPPLLDVTPVKGPPEILKDGVIEFVTGWVDLDLNGKSGAMNVAYINTAEEKVKVRVSVFKHSKLTPVNTIDFDLDPHEAFTLSIGIPAPASGIEGRSNYWGSIQATSSALIVQNVSFFTPGSDMTNFGYEKIAAFELPSMKRLW